MDLIYDPSHYVIEFIVSIALGFVFGTKFERIVVAFALVVLATSAIAIFHDETSNPNKYDLTNSTGVANLTKNITDYTTLGVNIILALAFGGVGTGLGVGFRKWL